MVTQLVLAVCCPSVLLYHLTVVNIIDVGPKNLQLKTFGLGGLQWCENQEVTQKDTEEPNRQKVTFPNLLPPAE